MEENIEEKFDEFEIICSPCEGHWQTHEVQDDKQRLFTLRFYRKLVHRCTLCGKMSKVFTEKLKK